MNPFLSIAEGYLQGKSISTPFRRTWSILLSIGITSFLFKKLYFHYTWIDFSDYKAILTFFIDGNFFVIALLFAFVHYALNILSTFLFAFTAQRTRDWFLKKIIAFRLTKKDFKSINKRINSNAVIPMPVKMDESVWIKWYYYIKSSVTEKEWEAAEKSTKTLERNFENDFSLIFKTIIAATVYFVTIPYFGLWSYVVALVILLVMFGGVWVLYAVVAVLPVLLRKADLEIKNYILSQQQAIEEANHLHEQ
jgi:hypothetical protein